MSPGGGGKTERDPDPLALGLCTAIALALDRQQALALMGRYMSETGLAPVARTRLDLEEETAGAQVQTVIRVSYGGPEGTTRDARGNRAEADETAMIIDGNL